MTSHDILLEARGISRCLPGGNGRLLKDICLEVRKGERIALVGPSGSGKTLLLRSLALLDPLDDGEVFWQGRPVRNETVPNFRRQVIYLHQRPALFEGSIEQNLRKPFRFKVHQASLFDRERVAALLAGLGRDESFLEKAQQELSGGEAQIVPSYEPFNLNRPSFCLTNRPPRWIQTHRPPSSSLLTVGSRRSKRTRNELWCG